MRTIQEIEQQFPGAAETGLRAQNAAQSASQYGRNRLTPLPREPLWKKFIEKFDEPIIKILLAAALLSMIVDIFKDSTRTGSVCFAVLVAIIAAAYALKQSQWVPTLMFVSAICFFFVGLVEGHFLVEGLA